MNHHVNVWASANKHCSTYGNKTIELLRKFLHVTSLLSLLLLPSFIHCQTFNFCFPFSSIFFFLLNNNILNILFSSIFRLFCLVLSLFSFLFSFNSSVWTCSLLLWKSDFSNACTSTATITTTAAANQFLCLPARCVQVCVCVCVCWLLYSQATHTHTQVCWLSD